MTNFVLTNYFHYRVNEALTERANQFGLILDDISITHLTFGREFTHAVELKQVAQQEAEKAKFLVEKAEQIKQANIISAEGDTKAAELLATAIGNAGEGLIELRRIKTAEDIYHKPQRTSPQCQSKYNKGIIGIGSINSIKRT